MSKFAGLWQYVGAVKPEIENALGEHLPLAPVSVSTNFNDALHYALFPGGKRLRPVLTLLGAELVGGRRERVLTASVAVEFVHTSSLIFDDLPCMDDAMERRGKTALHQKFGEDMAVLIGLALLNSSYGLIFAGMKDDCSACSTVAIRAHRELVNCIGTSGMVGGQSVDLALTQKENLEPNQFESLRNLKTSALIRMAISLGAILSGANHKQLEALSKFSELLGDAYQTSDDLLDLGEDLHISQTNERRTTFALERGVEATTARVSDFIVEAKDVLSAEFGASKPVDLLCELADYIGERRA
ncbi:MAG TPA: polyprenyl synthetase family protein [Pyrinomonadaceae bacterium]|nr:polyprenyl synthetase family protein [Pyrinomonadaceae bacterium]